MNLGFLFPAVLMLSASQFAWAYPQMVRNGYGNCTACHFSANGGSILTPYGRQLSREVLSTFGKEGEEAFAYGAVKLPEALSLQGDVRAIRSHRDTASASTKDLAIIMQADLIAALTYQKFLMVASGGYQQKSPLYPSSNSFVSRYHYVGYQATDEISVRAGKFQKTFGINTPEHTYYTKRNLGFDEGDERYILETAYLGETFNFYADGIFDRPDAKAQHKEYGAALTASAYFAERYKAGLSYYYGTSNAGLRHIVGPWAILGFTSRFYLLTEFDFERSLPQGRTSLGRWGVVDTQKLGYELFKGVQPFITTEVANTRITGTDSLTTAYGVGVDLYPRPHFDIQLFLQQYTLPGDIGSFHSWYWLMAHFYL